jgi:hypothetical protein
LAFLNGVVGGLLPWMVLKFMTHRQRLNSQLQSLDVLQLLNMRLIFQWPVLSSTHGCGRCWSAQI